MGCFEDHSCYPWAWEGAGGSALRCGGDYPLENFSLRVAAWPASTEASTALGAGADLRMNASSYPAHTL
jgi:hypothetical protein